MLLEMSHITKKYGSFTANKDIHFSLKKGEVHAIVGENGAGKTTLMKMLYGMEQPTEGEIKINGKEVDFGTPADAIKHGIGMVHQHFMLFSSFTAAENVVISHEPAKRGIQFDRKKRPKETEGTEYYFTNEEEFHKMNDRGDFIEVYESDGIYYGIKKADCERLLKESGNFFAILSPQGCEMFKKLFDKTLTVFVHADKDTVTQRQIERGDDPDTIERHLRHYDEIMEYQSNCDICIPNYDLASTAHELTMRIEAYLGIQSSPDSAY